ncbi:hypothetical protein ANN_26018 [Periplaneta americana]|uniref:DUF4817 domain-containing protein n=1 Tax=Periplaneta americana TaxID=6978 RepID=A0ABQ8S550_PERAM|nr:hypothetical protein ANN_26018 [Periplaneta americana]
MEEYLRVEYADLIFEYGRANGNSRQAHRLYRDKYPRRRHPAHTIFPRLLQRLREGGHISDIRDNLEGKPSVTPRDLPLSVEQLTSFKYYAKITSCDVNKSFSGYKSVLRDNRRSFSVENLCKVMVVNCNSSVNIGSASTRVTTDMSLVTSSVSVALLRKMDDCKTVTISTIDIDRLNKCKRKGSKQINTNKWKDVSRKSPRDSGLEYTTRKTKSQVSAKDPPSNEQICGKSCKEMCSQLALDVRKELFKGYYFLTVSIKKL